jgi:hypothetical protein
MTASSEQRAEGMEQRAKGKKRQKMYEKERHLSYAFALCSMPYASQFGHSSRRKSHG